VQIEKEEIALVKPLLDLISFFWIVASLCLSAALQISPTLHYQTAQLVLVRSVLGIVGAVQRRLSFLGKKLD